MIVRAHGVTANFFFIPIPVFPHQVHDFQIRTLNLRLCDSRMKTSVMSRRQGNAVFNIDVQACLCVFEPLHGIASAASLKHRDQQQAGMIGFITLQQSAPSQMAWQDSNAFREH
jgi:hypothetical protein